jgi:tRNA threonylcarbamoyladenosine modification (KEOPS) complex  Pcc1 subunit
MAPGQHKDSLAPHEVSAKADALITMGSKREAEILAKALSVDEKPAGKSSVRAESSGETLKLHFEAFDSASLRAVMNSSLREVRIANDALI